MLYESAPGVIGYLAFPFLAPLRKISFCTPTPDILRMFGTLPFGFLHPPYIRVRGTVRYGTARCFARHEGRGSVLIRDYAQINHPRVL